MQTYLINLDRSPDRLAFFKQQATANDIHFERIAAVDGKTLTINALQDAVASSFQFQPINTAEIGLFMSHKAAWQKLVDSRQPHAAIFEDDAMLSPSIKHVFDCIDADQPVFDIIKLETTLRQVVCERRLTPLSSDFMLQKLLSWHGGTAGYIISSTCARKMLSRMEKLADPVDQVLFNPMSNVSSSLQIFQVNPAVCIQKDMLADSSDSRFGSTIDRTVARGQLFRHGALIDLRRQFKKQLERSRRWWLARKTDNVQSVIPFESSRQLKRAS